MNSPYEAFNSRVTPQTQPLPFRDDQIANNAGGFGFDVGDWKAFERFLILGSEGGTFYVGETKLTLEAAQRVVKCIAFDGPRAIKTIVEVSDGGRAPKNDPALFALALAASAPDARTRVLALEALSKVARIPTHLFHFISYVQNHRGWGRGLKRAISEWYSSRSVEQLTYQMVKYQSRDGFSHRDVLRLVHPATSEAGRNALYKWTVDGYDQAGWGPNPAESNDKFHALPELIHAYQRAFKATPSELTGLIRQFNLSREMVPTEALKDPRIWEALLERMGPEAILRNLGNMSKIGLLKPFSTASKMVRAVMQDGNQLHKSRLHPITILIGLKVYVSGRSVKGGGVWTPDPSIVDALDDAFYLAFKNVVPTGKRILIGIDCSGSMTAGSIANIPMTAAEGAAAMALACIKTETDYHVICFDNQVQRVPGLTARNTLSEVLANTSRISGNGTDCAVPFLYALKEGMKVDAFLQLTDSETWVGRQGHPVQALTKYRERFGPTKSVVMGMTATNMTVNDPLDPNGLDVVGFDSAAPQAVAEFIR